MKGVVVRGADGKAFFIPQYDPWPDEKVLNVPLGDGRFFMTSAAEGDKISAGSRVFTDPVSGDSVFSGPETTIDLPYKLTNGYAAQAMTAGRGFNLGIFKIFLGSSDSLYLSKEANSNVNFTVDDGIYITSPRGSVRIRADPTYTGCPRIDNLTTDEGDPLFIDGVNMVRFAVMSYYGEELSCDPVYLRRV